MYDDGDLRLKERKLALILKINAAYGWNEMKWKMKFLNLSKA